MLVTGCGLQLATRNKFILKVFLLDKPPQQHENGKTLKGIVHIIIAVLLVLCVALSSGGQEARLDVPYVQTEDYIVDKMLGLLELRSSDILYDLGCGDGRIVIQAAKKTGIRGVGIDIDPKRIAESRANAIAAQVDDRTVFLQQDLFRSDFADATAVAIFLLPELNLRLRPKLFRDLKPGTRIVSHNFDMGDWEPDRKVFAGLWGDGLHYIYFWILPANVSGRWRGYHEKEEWTLTIRQRFQRIEGSLSVNGRTALPLPDMTLAGDTIRFVARSGNPNRRIVFAGKVTGNTMEGLAEETGTPGAVWKATRDPATANPIE